MERVKFTELSVTGGYNTSLRPGPLWFPMLMVFFALLLVTSTVRAHGGSGYYQIAGQPMGDYTIHVWTSPGLLRTGEVHVDTAVFDAGGVPAFDTVIMVTFTPMDKELHDQQPPKTAMAGSPYELYPYTREARFMLNMPGEYRLDVMLSDPQGMVGVTSLEVKVQTITGTLKLLILALGGISAACGAWLLLHVRSFWTPHLRRGRPQLYPKPQKLGDFCKDYPVPPSSIGSGIEGIEGIEGIKPDRPALHSIPRPHGAYAYAKSAASLSSHSPGWSPVRVNHLERDLERGGMTPMAANLSQADHGDAVSAKAESGKLGWYAWLNGPYHARALWIFMLVVVAHWMEHVLQIYQIYGLGWAPSSAGGLIGVFFPVLIASETLHFVYDFIQWYGIVMLRGGFRGRARTFWNVAMVAQTWHFIEHVLLMGQYLTGYYFFGRVKQTSILEYFFPREELHFIYNLVVFVPMVIAVHYYMRRQASQSEQNGE